MAVIEGFATGLVDGRDELESGRPETLSIRFTVCPTGRYETLDNVAFIVEDRGSSNLGLEFEQVRKAAGPVVGAGRSTP